MFPKLADSFLITSEETENYNCVAWAAGDTAKWWWPSPDFYWPPGIPRAATLENFVLAFATLGYEISDTHRLEPDYEKVAIYAVGDTPKHMARQLSTGVWTSKLGQSFDIEHSATEEVEHPDYGQPRQVLRRPKSQTQRS